MIAGVIVRENPARTAEVVGAVEETPVEAVEAIVVAASSAQPGWAGAPVAERAEVLRVAADRLESRLDAIAELTSRETGKVLGDARGEAGFAGVVLRWYAERAADLLADRTVDDQAGRLRIRHRPFGVVAAITPWNAPLILTMLKAAPALAAGNAIVVKPSPLAPFGVVAMLESLAECLPAGLVSVVQGGAEQASALVGHPSVAKVAFTGGDVAGREVAALAGRALTPSVLELGGNDPAIVLDDADLDQAAYERMLMAAFATSGQVCMALKRLYVPARRHDEVVEGLAAAAARVLRVGDPLADGVTMGPVVSGQARDRVAALIAGARSEGARVLEIGSVAGDLSAGYFAMPALVTDAREDSPVVATEQFGPVLPVLAYDHLDEAVERANGGDLGLGASVWSADEEAAFAVAARLDAGFAFVNTHNRTGMALRAPFGGVKRSGWGREYGEEGLMEYVQPCVTNAPAAFRRGGAGLAGTAYPAG